MSLYEIALLLGSISAVIAALATLVSLILQVK
jgi:hypothetical protein